MLTWTQLSPQAPKTATPENTQNGQKPKGQEISKNPGDLQNTCVSKGSAKKLAKARSRNSPKTQPRKTAKTAKSQRAKKFKKKSGGLQTPAF